MEIPREMRAFQGQLTRLSSDSERKPRKILFIKTSMLQHFYDALELVSDEFPNAETSVFSHSDNETLKEDSRVHMVYWPGGGGEKQGERVCTDKIFSRLRREKFDLIVVLKTYTPSLMTKLKRLAIQAFALTLGGKDIIVTDKAGGASRLSLGLILLKFLLNALYPIFYVFQKPINFILNVLFALGFFLVIAWLFTWRRVLRFGRKA